MPPLFARQCSLLLTAILLLCIPQTSQASTSPGASLARTQSPALTPTATSFFWYSPPLSTNSSPQRISSLAFDPATAGLALAASGNSGDAMQRTTDHGVTWSPLAGWNPSDTRFPYAVTYGSRKQTFFAWGGTDIYSSTNGGESWAHLPYDTNCNQVLLLVAHPTDPKTLFVSTFSGLHDQPGYRRSRPDLQPA